MSRGPDAVTSLSRALISSAEEMGCPITIDQATAERWSSATFTGAQHMLALTAPPSPAFDDWLAALPEYEFRLPGHLVADIHVTQRFGMGSTSHARIEALTVEDV